MILSFVNRERTVEKMADIRDVESLRNYLFRKADDDNTNNPYKIAKIHAYRDAFERLLALPTIESEPIKHGRWIYIGDETEHAELLCSECGEGVYNKMKFCPNCRARMDGKPDELQT